MSAAAKKLTTIGQLKVTLKGGQSKKVTIKLNAKGKKLRKKIVLQGDAARDSVDQRRQAEADPQEEREVQEVARARLASSTVAPRRSPGAFAGSAKAIRVSAKPRGVLTAGRGRSGRSGRRWPRSRPGGRRALRHQQQRVGVVVVEVLDRVGRAGGDRVGLGGVEGGGVGGVHAPIASHPAHALDAQRVVGEVAEAAVEAGGGGGGLVGGAGRVELVARGLLEWPASVTRPLSSGSPVTSASPTTRLARASRMTLRPCSASVERQSTGVPSSSAA